VRSQGLSIRGVRGGIFLNQSQAGIKGIFAPVVVQQGIAHRMEGAQAGCQLPDLGIQAEKKVFYIFDIAGQIPLPYFLQLGYEFKRPDIASAQMFKRRIFFLDQPGREK
jgi:hypothetical protein